MSEQPQGNGTISENDLMRKLVQSKKVMNAVDSKNFSRGNINENIVMNAPENIDMSQIQPKPTKPVGGPMSVDKIKNSKLPDAIKQAMIDHPIEQMPSISLNETLDMNVVKGARRLMEQEGVISKQSTRQPQSTNSNIDMNMLATLVENTVRKVLDEKLNQILTAQQTQSINENLVLKVGDSVFKGKITGVNKAK